jgi:polysaccharide biosynthesis transport protein
MNNAHRDTAQESSAAGRALVTAGNSSVILAKRDQYYPRGLEAPEEGNDLANSLRQYLHILLKRKWLILSLTLVFFVLGGIRGAMKTPLYSSTARIQIDREPGKIIEGGSTSPSEEGGTEFLRTQYEILKSRAMAERVVSALRIHEDKAHLSG